MQHRHLGRCGLMVSEIAYGNWITHGSQVAEDAAVACVRATLDAGVTTFDTSDVYAGTRAESVLGRFDVETLEETLKAFDDPVRQGKVLYVGVSEWTAGQIASALEIAAAGVTLDAGLMRRIDDVLDEVIIRDPALTRSPARRP